MNDKEKMMTIALKEAKKAYKKEEVPVGAVIVHDNKIISKAYNTKESKNNALYHAELIAINKACKKMKDWRLDECDLYVTLEPCLMCCGAIIQSRIKNVYYGSVSPKFGYVKSLDNCFDKNNNHKPNTEGGILEKECSELLKEFFKNKR